MEKLLNYAELYEETFRNYTDVKLKNNGLNMNELFDKMSVKFQALNGNETIYFTYLRGKGNQSHLGEEEVTNQYYYYHGQPLETIVIRTIFENNVESLEEIKCLTFFSYAQEEWRNFQAQLDAISLVMLEQFTGKSMMAFSLFTISIHSPNHLPDYNVGQDFQQFNYLQIVTIKYSEQKIYRLGKGYDTDCYDYDSDTNFNYYRMRSDCVNDCYQDKMRELCKVDHGLFMSHALIRKEYLMNGNNRLISCYNKNYNRQSYLVKRDCDQMCKVECKAKYYGLEYEISNIQDSLEHENGVIIIRHSAYPDIIVKYIPEMNLIGFLCNFGGLLGMWLGLSLFGILKDVFIVMTKFSYRKFIDIISLNVNSIINHVHCKFIYSRRCIVLKQYI